MMRPVAVGSATATFAAKLAALPITSSAHGRTPAPGGRRAPCSVAKQGQTGSCAGR